MTKTRSLAIGILLATMAIGVLVFQVVKPPASAGIVDREWPQLTMVYEADGAAVAVGDNPAVVTREVHRLEFRSKTDWRDTVIEGPLIHTRVGGFSNTGSYEEVRGNTYTRFHSIYNGYDSEIVESGRRVAGLFMAPFSIERSGYQFSRVGTEAKVCFRELCEEGAIGLEHTLPDGEKVQLVDDARGIPLTFGTRFVVKELQIDDSKIEPTFSNGSGNPDY